MVAVADGLGFGFCLDILSFSLGILSFCMGIGFCLSLGLNLGGGSRLIGDGWRWWVVWV